MFDPRPGTEIVLGDKSYRVCAHPLVASQPYIQEGKAGRVFKLDSEGGQSPLALKVFHPPFRDPSLVEVSRALAPLAGTPGLRVCEFTVLHTRNHPELLQDYSDLIYALVMPWIPGPTWQEVVITGTPELKPERCLSLALSLVDVLVLMEQRKVAHCDISGGNILLPGLLDGAGGYPVEFVDVEQMYSPNHSPPDILPKGSPGYGHFLAGAPNYWSPKADRFSGAILVAELLSWWDPDVRSAKSGESFFSPDAVSDDRVRSELLVKSLSKRWGQKIAALFKRAFESQSLDLCPVFEEWRAALMTAGRLTNEPKAAEVVKRSSGAEAKQLMDRARRLDEQGRLEEALELYRQVLLQPGLSRGLLAEVPMLIEDLERTLADRAREPDLPPPSLDLLVNPVLAGGGAHASDLSTMDPPAIQLAPPRRRVLRLALAGASLSLLLAGGLWGWFDRPGSIRVTTNVDGTRVLLDGKFLGITAASDIGAVLSIPGVDPGTRELTLEHEHYQRIGPKKIWVAPASELVATESLQPKPVPVVLDISPGPVDLVVGSDSHHAVASGSELSLLPGTYEVSASKGSHKPFTGKLEVKAGPGFHYTIALDADTAPLLVKLKQSPANLVIAGKSYPAVKDGATVQAPVGLADIKVSKDGYQDFSTQLDVKSGQTGELAVSMVPKSLKLFVSSNVDVPKVFVIAASDGKKRWGEKTLTGKEGVFDLPPGSYRVKAVKTGFLAAEIPVEIKIGQDKKVQLVEPTSCLEAIKLKRSSEPSRGNGTKPN